MKKLSNKFHQGTLTMINFGDLCRHIALKLEKVGPIFLSLNPCLCKDRKQFQCPNVAFIHNKPGPFLGGVKLMRRHIFSFKKDCD